MGAVSKQERMALRYAQVEWSSQVEDPRDKQGQRHAHPGVLGLLVAAFACAKVGLEEAEELSEDLGPRLRKKLKLKGKVSDTTLWRMLEQQNPKGFRETLRQWVKAALSRCRFPPLLPMGVVSFDGKSLYTSTQQPVAGLESVAYDEQGAPVWKLGAVRAALTSIAPAPCLDMELVHAKQGESPAFRVLWPRVVEHFGEHFQVMTGDAGLCAAENAALVLESKKHYLLGLKGNQPTLHAYAQAAIASNQGPPRARTEDRAHGESVVRELWTHALSPGEVDFPGARLLLGVRQTHLKKDGTSSVEWRYFVTSLCTVELAFKHLLKLVRLHWAIENQHHWTLDVVLKEDERQPCMASASSLEVTAWLRTLAYNLLAFWRAMLSMNLHKRVRWKRACEKLRDALVQGLQEVPLPTPA